jgi:hypothetical protein
MQCARHPKVETELTCGRCETPICPRCAVFTDVGARCPTCAPARKLPQFEVGFVYLLRGAAAALGTGAALGAAWGALLPGGIGFLGLFMAAFLGYAIAEAVSVVTNRKAGTALQVVAAAGALAAYLVRNLVIGDGLLPTDDLFGYIAVIVAGAVAISRLRY